MPCTPPPGGVDAEQRNRRGFGVEYGIEPRHRAREELEQVGDAAGDRAADVVRVVALEIRRCASRGARGCDRGSRARSARSAARSPSVRSTVDPAGHVAVGVAGVLAGGRAASDRTGSAARRARTGRSGCSPRHTAASAAAISSSVPPTCTVEASRQRGSRHGIGPSSAQSSLNDARAVAVAAQAAHVAGGQDRPADVGELRRAGVEEHDARRRQVGEAAHRHAGLDAAAELAQVATRARAAIACEPPAATGQSSTCAGEREDHRRPPR